MYKGMIFNRNVRIVNFRDQKLERILQIWLYNMTKLLYIWKNNRRIFVHEPLMDVQENCLKHYNVSQILFSKHWKLEGKKVLQIIYK